MKEGFPELLKTTKKLAKEESEDLHFWLFCILLSERARLYATVCEIPNSEVRDRLASLSDVAREIIDGLFLKGDIQNTMRMAQIRDLERRRPLVGRALRRLEMAQSDFVETLAADEARPDRSSE